MPKTPAPIRWLGATDGALTQPKPIVDIGISRNGRFVVTSDPLCVFRVFDLRSGHRLPEAKVPAKLRAKFDELRDLSVSDDGRRVVGQLENWVISGDVTAWEPQVRASSRLFGRARALPDARSWAHLHGGLDAYDGENTQRRVVDLTTGEPIATASTDLWAVSADGSVLVAARGASVVPCDPRTFEELEAAPPLRTNVRGLGWEPSGGYLWSADDEHAHRWSLRDDRVDTTIAIPSTEDGTLVAANGRALIVRSSYKSAERLSLPSGERSGTSDGSWRELPVSFDGSHFARFTGTSMQIKTWDDEVAAEWAVSERVSAGAFDPDGTLFVTFYRGGRVDIREAASGVLVAELQSGAPRTFGVAVSPGARWLAICADSQRVYVVDVAQRALAHVLRLPMRTTGPVALSADGRWVAASDQVSTNVWSVATGERQHALKAGAHALAFSPDSAQLALGGAGTLGVLVL